MNRQSSGAPGHANADSVAALGPSLTERRVKLGLTVDAAATGAGLALADAQRLEAGAFDSGTDVLAVLRALRTYADFLGLSGDRLTLTLVEQWTGPPRLDDAGAIPVSVSASTPIGTESASSGSGVATGLFVDPTAAPAPGALADAGPPTGVMSLSHHRRHYSGRVATLRTGIALTTFALTLALIGLVVAHVQPQWLRTLGIMSTSAPSTSQRPAPAAVHAPSPGAPSLSVTDQSPTGETVAIAAPSFTIDVAAVGAPGWVQVTASGSSTPLFTQVLRAGASKSFTVTNPLSVEVGASAVHITVVRSGAADRTVLPPAAPYTFVFKAS